jgi:DNA-binding CsgD family transcriptional regulator
VTRNATAVDINVSRRAKKETAPKTGRQRYPSDLIRYPLSMSYDRQARLIRMLAFGLSDKELADALGISYNSVGENVARLRRITGVRNRTHFTGLALREGLVTAEELRSEVRYVNWKAKRQDDPITSGGPARPPIQLSGQ